MPASADNDELIEDTENVWFEYFEEPLIEDIEEPVAEDIEEPVAVIMEGALLINDEKEMAESKDESERVRIEKPD